MQWNLEGLRVWGHYLDMFPVSGEVVLSRVCYGGGVQHTVVLEQPLTVFGRVREAGERVLLDHKDVVRVKDAV
jgi:hypothetical protein